MAIRAPDLAFRDFCKDDVPRDRAMHEPTHIGPLVAKVVEVEYLGI